MLKNIAPLLAVMDVTVVLKKHSDDTDFVALIVPKPRKKAKNEKLNSFPPIIRRGPIEKLEAELNGQTVLSRLAEFRDLIVQDAAFNKAVQEVKEAPAKADAAGSAKTPAKRATRAKPEEAPPAKDKDVVLLEKNIVDMDKLIEASKADEAASKYTATVSLFKAIKERDASLVEGLAEKIRPMKDRIAKIQQQTLDL